MKTINNKQYNECNVVMLATDRAESILRGQLWTHNNGGTTQLRIWNNPTEKVSPTELKGYCIPQHLYILSDEEIKEGDWFLMNGCILRQCSLHKGDILDTLGGLHHESVCKKIIATTDKSLMYLESDYTCYLPQIPQSFIEYFVEQYNKGNVIDKVLVEWEESYDFGYRNIKINPDNTINILTQKDSWSREEVETILLKLMREQIKFPSYNSYEMEEWYTEWISKNL